MPIRYSGKIQIFISSKITYVGGWCHSQEAVAVWGYFVDMSKLVDTSQLQFCQYRVIMQIMSLYILSCLSIHNYGQFLESLFIILLEYHQVH